MENSLKKERYAGLDALKAICAFLVVCAHEPFQGNFGKYMEDICSLAVPCFFMISGFFYPNAIRKSTQLKQIRNIAKLTAISLIAYFVWTWVFYRWTGQDFSYITNRLLSFNGAVKFLFFNNPFFGYHLWYLMAILYVLIFVYVGDRLKLKKLMICSAPFLLFCGIALGRYSDLFFGRFISLDISRNCYFLGFPFFCIGWFIGDNFNTIKEHLNKKVMIILAIVFGIMGPTEHLILEYIGHNMEGDMYFSTAFFAVSTFLYFAAFNDGIKALSTIGRNYSTGIYIVHAFVLDTLYTIASKTRYESAYIHVAPLIIFAVSLALVWLWKKLVKVVR